MSYSVLVPLEGSPSSEAATRQAITLAKRRNFQLCGLAVIDVPGITKPSMAPLGGHSYRDERDKALLEDAQKRAYTFHENFKKLCEEQEMDGEVLLKEGDPCQAICDEAERHDLIVIGHKTNFYFETQEDGGQTLSALAKDTPRPILAVEENEFQEENVMVCYDGSHPAARALQIFTLIFKDKLPKFHVVTVDKKMKRAEELCSYAVDYLKNHTSEVEAYPIESSSRASEIILSHVEHIKPGCLVVGAHSGSLLEHFFGDTTNELLNACMRPLFIYH